MVEGDEKEILNTRSDIILHGKKGRTIKARTLNQRRMVEEIAKNDMLFAIGPAGTGKTYLYKKVLHYVRMTGRIALAVAVSGIAALLLPDSCVMPMQL